MAAALIPLATALLATAIAAVPAAAATIDVRPNHLGSLQRAIDRADPGDRLRVHEGHYLGAVNVDKRLTVAGATGENRPVIDGACETGLTLNVTRPGVTLRGLKVIGAAEGFGAFSFAVNFNGIETGTVRDLRLRDSCGSAEYGVNVFASGRIKITDSFARGFTDAGYYIGGIADTSAGALIVRDNTATGNNRGLIVEDSAAVDVRVTDNTLDANTIGGEGTPSGIFIHNSDGILIENNETHNNGVYGIHLDPTSDDNVLNGNVATGNGTANLFDEGTGNCGSFNSFPLTAC